MLSTPVTDPHEAFTRAFGELFGLAPEQLRAKAGTTHGVICNANEAGTYEYVCRVEVSEFPADPPEFTRLRIPPQTYAIFEHRDISAIVTTWKSIWEQGRTGLGGLEIWIPVNA